MMPAHIEVQHGYTLRDLDRLTRVAVRMAYLRALPAQDRYDEAFSAIALALAAADEPPTERELKAAGIRAILDLHRDDNHHHGVDTSNPHLGHESMPRFQAYWANSGSTSSFEDRVVDRVALAQIWPMLTNKERDTLTALAAHEDHAAAREASGARAVGTYKANLKHARDRFLRLWHEGETPSRLWAKSMGVNSGRRPVTRVLADRRSQRARRERAA